jgi:hypothetical protein
VKERRVKTADAISEILKREGVEWVIGYPVNHIPLGRLGKASERAWKHLVPPSTLERQHQVRRARNLQIAKGKQLAYQLKVPPMPTSRMPLRRKTE